MNKLAIVAAISVLAICDDAAAPVLQERLGDGFRVHDFFPEAGDHPEGIQDAEIQSRYAGGGPALSHLSGRG